MKKSTSISVLVLVSLAVGISHVGWAALDNGILLNLDGRHIDIVGMAKDRYTKISRNCSSVSRLKPEDKEYQSAVRLIIEYSPPQSQSVQLSSAWGAGKWTLAEAEFADLLPAVVLIDNSEVEPKIVGNAIWSGYTHPWKAAPFIRDYLSRQAPDAPLPLLACFDPQLRAFM